MSKYKFLIDWDGTIFLGQKRIVGSEKLFKFLCLELDAEIYYVTNNSSRNTNQYINILKKNNLWNNKCKMITSGGVAANYLSTVLKSKYSYILGNDNLKKEFKENGIIHSYQKAQSVVVGFDTTLTFKKIQKAHFLILKKLPFIATHDDKVCPVKNGSIIDCGSILEALKVSAQTKPIIIGKPYNPTLKYLKFVIGSINIQSSFMIGDNSETDGVLANKLNLNFINVRKFKSLIEVTEYIKKISDV